LIAVVDYGMGNLRSVSKALEKVGQNAVVTSDPAIIDDAQGMVLPGVGAFPDCMRNLTERKLAHPVVDFINKGRPFFGICLGLQLLFTEGYEFGRHDGLGIIPGKVVRFEGKSFVGENKLKVPHMGWNQVDWNSRNCAGTPFQSINNGEYFYFVHSFYVEPDDDKYTIGTTEYGIEFVSAVRWKNVFATQFHPEKSQEKGLSILRAFGEYVNKWES
jgi:imidazole glycerol-phosphate synthase subunit HisH